jgi:ABC-type multidrug transport system fused ATPase/permease subunit
MDELITFFNKNITEMIMIFIGIYVLLYILNIDLLLIVAFILFGSYFYYKYLNREKEKDLILKNTHVEKYKNELPYVISKHDKIINFLFYISDFKQYNEKVYASLLVNLNDFLTLVEDYKIIHPNQHKLMADVLSDTRSAILNGLGSFIFSFNNSPALRMKLDDAIKRLNIILLNYLIDLDIAIDHIKPANSK